MSACGPNFNLYVLAAIGVFALTAVVWVLTVCVRVFTRLTAPHPPEPTGEHSSDEVPNGPSSPRTR
jgi:hypothetical protein